MVEGMPTATKTAAPTKRAARKASPSQPARTTPVSQPEVLIRIAFKEDDLRTVIESLDLNDPKVAPVALRLRKRMADHELAKLT